MSYILNALRKSERERQAQREETLSSGILERKVHTQNKTSSWMILLVLINAAILGYFVMQHLEKPEAESIKIEEQLIQTAKIVVAEKTKAVNEKTQITPKHTLKPLTIDDIIKTKNSQSEKILQPPKTKSQEQPEEKQLEMEIKPVINQVPKEQNSTVPLLSELPFQFRRNVPEVAINVFVYSDLPENRFIMVAMQKHVAGQEIVSGMVLKEIQADGIVVEFKGEVFRIKRN